MTFFIKRTSRTWTLKKYGHYAKIPYIDGKHLNDKLDVADFKCGNNFPLKLQPKNT